jgi:hypothetical protein
MLSYLCLFAHSDVQPVLCSVFVLFGKVSCNLFIYLFLACKEFIARMKLIEYSPLQSKENYFQRLDAKLIVNNTFDVTFTCINDNKLIGMSTNVFKSPIILKSLIAGKPV